MVRMTCSVQLKLFIAQYLLLGKYQSLFAKPRASSASKAAASCQHLDKRIFSLYLRFMSIHVVIVSR